MQGNVVVMQNTQELVSGKRVRFYNDTGDSVTLKGGYPVCYDQDYGTASSVDYTRAHRVLKPAAGIEKWLAGFVSKKYDGVVVADGGTHTIEIETAIGQPQLEVWTDQSCTLDTTFLSVVGGQWALGANTEGPVVAKALQTVDRSSTAGLVQAKVLGIDRDLLLQDGAAGASSFSPLIWDSIPIKEIQNDPAKGFVFFDDFLGPIDVTSADGWTLTQVTSGGISGVVDEQGGVLLVDSQGNASADDGVNAQLINCMVKPAAGVKIAFEARVKVVDAGDDQYFIGLAGVDTTLIAAGVIDDVVDKCGFFRHATSTADKISSICSRTSADDATADVADLADDTYVTLGFVIDGLTSVKFYVNGVLVETGTTTASIPNAVMCLSAVAQVEQTSADAEMSIDWVRIAQVGGRA